MPEGGAYSSLKRLVLGRPIPTHLAHHERLSRVTGLAVLSSDALSSVAYATEEILRVLVIGGLGILSLATPIALLIAALLGIVAFSYRQTITAYPSGGGAYIVSKDNLGINSALIAAAALLIDYTLTVAVSIAAGVAAVTSAFPSLHVNRVELSLVFLAILAVGNLRGIRESGRIFAVPTYFFIVMILTLLGVGIWRYAAGTIEPIHADHPLPIGNSTLGLFMLLTAFSNGCTAMTGVEAVSNGVPAFRPPEAKNAVRTLITMAVLGITMFVGITLLARAYNVLPSETETVVSQIARGTFGGRGVLYLCVQLATMLILVLAANTAYSDFPRLASIVARDAYLPRQFSNLGDRLAFSNGIVVLSVFAGILLVAFGGDTHSLIPLYMIGVFISFTLSQTGMVIHWRKLRESGWRTSALVNGVGAIATGIVLVIVATNKALEGAWIIIVLIPVLVAVFKATHRHYTHVADQLSLRGWEGETRQHSTVLVPIGGVHRAVLQAVSYARSLSDDVRALFVDTDAAATERVRNDWNRWGGGTRLEVLASPYRSLMEPLLEYIDQLQAANPRDYVTVILPEFVPARWWQHLLHNQRALLIKGALLFRPRVVVTSVPFHLER
ncbi:MAG TPA: APC family permease [Vicinamibacterales bacterium]|nr:APC family permease [Vicinamibacterales bacterium]